MAGQNEAAKVRAGAKNLLAVKETICPDERSISVSFEDVASERWMDEVYIPDILMKQDMLQEKPGYGELKEGLE